MRRELCDDAVIEASVLSAESETEDGPMTQYGLRVTMSVDGKTVTSCVLPDISPDRGFAERLAHEIEHERIDPSLVCDYVEAELSR